MFKYLVFLLYWVYGILAVSTDFISKNKRGEIFELTDNEVPVFRITLPKDDYKNIIEYSQVFELEEPTSYLGQLLADMLNIAERKLGLIILTDFNKYKDIDVRKELPELNIDENGHARINASQILQGYIIDELFYRDFDFENKDIYEYFMSRNPYFNLYKVEQIIPMLRTGLEGNLHMVKRSSNEPRDYKTKNATLIVELAGKKHEFEKVNVSLGGQYSRHLSKPNFNIKIHGEKDLYGRRNFKLRSDYTEPTFLRSKLTSDIYDRLGTVSISANYANLYINDRFMGLFVLTDTLKLSWAELVYGDVNSKNLYQCTGGANLTYRSINSCQCEYKMPYNRTEWAVLLKTLDNAKSARDLENVIDFDQFIYSMAVEYLLGSWDNYRNSNNFYMYKPLNSTKWLYIGYDFDHNFGTNLDYVFASHIYLDLPEAYERVNKNYPEYSIDKWFSSIADKPLIKYLILKDRTRFYEALRTIIEKVFNPGTLFLRIDELKEFIRPYVEIEYTPDENGKLPGRINESGNDPYTFAEWEANSEFTTVKTAQYNAYGIKYWILSRYRYICKTFDFNCDPIYLDENYSYSINKEVEFKGYFPNRNNNKVSTTTTTSTSFTTIVGTPTSTINPESEEKMYQCMAELAGYTCCPPEIDTVYFQDEYGDWGVNPENNNWCGITKYVDEYSNSNKVCWSESVGYPCCTGCEVVEVEDDKKWGVESNE